MIYGYIRVSTVNFKCASRKRRVRLHEKAMGVRLGRPCGKAKKVKLSDKKEVIQDLLALQISKMNIARIFDISVPTLYRFIECENLYLPKELKKGLFVKKESE